MQNRESGYKLATWQHYLKQLLRDKDSRVRDQLVEGSGLRLITFQRWANGTSKPREDNLRLLLSLLPAEHQEPFARLAATDYPALSPDDLPAPEPESTGLPAEFYVRTLQTLAITPLPMARETLLNLLFRQAFDQLDAERAGLSLSVACCVPPRPDEQIYSLRNVGGVGTSPWSPDIHERTMFLGAESLVGHTLTSFQPGVINSHHEITLLPANWTTGEESTATFPLARFAKVAGCLLVRSTEEGFFTSKRISLLEHITYLVALAFEQDEFYNPDQINLKMMPSEEVQAPYLRSFHQRVRQRFAKMTDAHYQINWQKIHQSVWQEIQDELAEEFLRRHR